MIEWIYVFGKIVITSIVCIGIISILAEYWEKAKSAFNKAWNEIKRLFRAAGILIRRGNKLFKMFVAQKNNGEIETYEDADDMGVEIDINDPNLTPEVRTALSVDDFLVVEQYNN